MDDIKEHVNSMSTSWYIHGVLMDDIWTIYKLYKYGSNTMGTSCQVLL